jgi:hypothetical protein
MFSRNDLIFYFFVILFLIGFIFLVVYYKASDEDKQIGYLIAGWILVSPPILLIAYGILAGILMFSTSKPLNLPGFKNFV